MATGAAVGMASRMSWVSGWVGVGMAGMVTGAVVGVASMVLWVSGWVGAGMATGAAVGTLNAGCSAEMGGIG